MPNHEIELKFPVTDPAALESRLRELGFRIDTPRTFEHNTLYDTPSRDLRARTEILRIRQYGPTWTVTHKGLSNTQTAEPSRYKVRIETETAVIDGQPSATSSSSSATLPPSPTRSTAPSARNHFQWTRSSVAGAEVASCAIGVPPNMNQ